MSSHSQSQGNGKGFAPMNIETSPPQNPSSSGIECTVLPGSPSVSTLIKISLAALGLGLLIGTVASVLDPPSSDNVGVRGEGVGSYRPHQSKHSTNPSKYGGVHPETPEGVMIGAPSLEEEDTENKNKSGKDGKNGGDGTPSGDDANNSNSNNKEPPPIPIPPAARRDESAFILAGKLPPSSVQTDTDGEIIPRQAIDSPYPLLDPPKAVPNPYQWMRSDDRSSQQVVDHLKMENDYTNAVTGHLTELRTDLYKEMVSGMLETDYTTPGKHGDWWYYRRTYEGKSYPVHCRAPVDTTVQSSNMHSGKVRRPTIAWDHKSPNAAMDVILPGEHIYLDENELAEGKEYCSTKSVEESPSHKLVAYTVDYTGDEKYELRVKNVDTDEEVDFDANVECDRTVCWGSDDTTLFYLKMDDAHRPYQVYRRRIGGSDERERGDGGGDELLFQEDDDLYWTGISKSADERYLFISTSSAETSEVHYLDLHYSDATLKCVATRRKKVLYGVEHRNGQWLITTNAGGTPNFRLLRCRATEETADMWKDMRSNMDEIMFDGSADRSLDHVEPFKRHAVAVGREGGIPRVWIIRFGEEEELLDIIDFTRIAFAETAYDVGLGPNYEYGASELVLSYDSLITPLESIVVDMDDPTQDVEGRTVLKQKNVPGYDRSLFGCDRITVTSRDGKTEIPVSLVYRTDVMDGHTSTGRSVPVHLYGYGSYGSNVEADFRSTRLPLLNRGMVYVIAHVRGGGEMGRQWYEEPNGAKYLCKANTFNDFVDVARYLVEDRKLTRPAMLSCEGRSAGGLLIGASLNQAPDLFGVAILGVPFVDVVATMIDASIPLTAGEWEEWGNPNEERFFDYMMSYCPMSNVKKGAAYPSMLLTGGLHDPRVQYWEPTKFAAELRHTQDGTKSGPVCLKIDMTAGHFSASDRYKYLKEVAFDWAFLLDQLGLA